MRLPDKHKVSEIKGWSVSRETKSGCWIPARPLACSWLGLRRRLFLVWGVFTGRYDVLDWEEER